MRYPLGPRNIDGAYAEVSYDTEGGPAGSLACDVPGEGEILIRLFGDGHTAADIAAACANPGSVSIESGEPGVLRVKSDGATLAGGAPADTEGS